jgi:hypothetical protein
MKTFFIAFIALTSFIVTTSSCKKKKPGNTTPAEAALVISTDAGTNILNPGATLNFNTKITSTMPPNGVKIGVTLVEEVGGANIPQVTGFNSTSTSIPTQLTNLPQQKWCVCTVKATSLSTSSNTAQTTFRVIFK